jgi:hypothetical protein
MKILGQFCANISWRSDEKGASASILAMKMAFLNAYGYDASFPLSRDHRNLSGFYDPFLLYVVTEVHPIWHN